MIPQDPNFKEKAYSIFSKANFVNDVGIELTDVGPGWSESILNIIPKHLQQDQFIHAGVQATMADHTAGAAAGSLVKENETILSVEFKINLLRPAIGEQLRCRAEVLKQGKTLTIVESAVYAINDNQEKLVSKATVTLAIVSKPEIL